MRPLLFALPRCVSPLHFPVAFFLYAIPLHPPFALPPQSPALYCNNIATIAQQVALTRLPLD